MAIWGIHHECTVKELQDRKDLQFINDSQDVKAVYDYFGINPANGDYNSFFVNVQDGDYIEIWGMRGIIPWDYNTVHRLI